MNNISRAISTFKLSVFAFSKKKQVLICPDKFKFSMTAAQICKLVEQGLPKEGYESRVVGLADGGEGSLETIAEKVKGEWIDCDVFDPLFRKITAQYYAAYNQQSYIEMAKASGLQLLTPQERNPMKTSTYGTGQLILESLKRGHKTVNLLIGGSATNQGGIGVADALGYTFQDENGRRITPIGQNLIKIRNIRHRDSRLKKMVDESRINVFTDVNNPFTGSQGATRVYGPQKGANPSSIEALEAGMVNLNNLFTKIYGIDLNKLAGSGAAGGLGGGCSILLNSKLQRGIDLIFSLTDFDKWAKESDIIITGEGKVDSQTMQGKVVKGVIQRAKKHNKKVIVLCAFCENPEQFRERAPNAELVELLKKEERSVIDPSLTKKRLQQFLHSYFPN